MKKLLIIAALCLIPGVALYLAFNEKPLPTSAVAGNNLRTTTQAILVDEFYTSNAGYIAIYKEPVEGGFLYITKAGHLNTSVSISTVFAQQIIKTYSYYDKYRLERDS